MRRSAKLVSHITTPIFYPNARPHLGHLYSSLLCDVQHRWKLLKGVDSLLTTGTDEHGLKIQLASEKNHYKNPRKFVDKLFPEFIGLDKFYNVKFTKFIRTTDPFHIENVLKLWELCNKNGYIYKGEHHGWYSISDETFYPESKVIVDPKDSTRHINTESFNEVIYQSETNYYFKLSAFQDKMLDYIENQNPEFVYPSSKRDQLVKDLKTNPLQDLSISRPASRLQWGITVPNDPEQKIYVWFDALCNYVSAIGGIDTSTKPATIPSLHWTQTTHLIGKDITKFHCLYWPSFLMAADLPLPKRVVIHNHWISNGMKMSKSLGNVIDPIVVGKKYGPDIVRWYLLENSKIDADGDFIESNVSSLRQLFVSKWGNLINRCCGQKFNISRAIGTFSMDRSDRILNLWKDNSEVTTHINNIFEQLNKLPRQMDEKIDKFDHSNMLKEIWNMVNDANLLIQVSKPWEKPQLQQDSIIFLCIETARILSILTQPIIPMVSSNFLDRMDIKPERRTLDFVTLGSDNNYGENANSSKRNLPLELSPSENEFTHTM
ncbi:similar to Saccharomyces cerevisiae YGR171C MSM1 Mitochondrial methionyl-tRNA synthetase (MetRS), functions as a monomer in mitochondrial protein synthesis [Maudiozyma saulgeensis]|uniref:Methionine--tRNA ligase, mitochondrial n=1 Tax=Maudiozyma saulgeensis TaxID=1789683 RepID=A0A1X7R7M1_9SACH|nr:similar to Saccharomyces cerevisiae YGR171C MSM1 Mitochondrial methionyl-tRNA synthetase (MetRS), functions as a monomer in mitochondrial protein synthesis [Kazachstania saulgeensis]